MKFKDALDNVKREIAIMKKLRHINCIKLFEVIENPDNDKLYMGFSYLKLLHIKLNLIKSLNSHKEGN